MKKIKKLWFWFWKNIESTIESSPNIIQSWYAFRFFFFFFFWFSANTWGLICWINLDLYLLMSRMKFELCSIMVITACLIELRAFSLVGWGFIVIL